VNAKTYFDQAKLVLDEHKTEIRYNSEWCDALGARGMIQLASRYTVARMMERNDFSDRFKAGTPISVHEFLYPLVQGTTRWRSSATSNSAAPTRNSIC
jgi:tyrosyl-tRNA synthetase